MNLDELFSAFQTDEGLKSEFAGALEAGKAALEKFLKDHDIAAAISEVVAYVQEHGGDLLKSLSPDLLQNAAEAVSGIVGDGAEGIVDKVADAAKAVTPDAIDGVVDQVASSAKDAVSDGASAVADAAKTQGGSILDKIKSFFMGQ